MPDKPFTVPEGTVPSQYPPGITAPLGEMIVKAMNDFAAGDFLKAEQGYRSVAALLHWDLSAIFNAQWKRDDAVTSCLMALELCPQFKSAQLRLGELYYAMGKFDKAEAEWRDLLADDPQNAKANDYLGHCLMGQGLHDEAHERFKWSAAIDPKWFMPRSHLAWLSTYLQMDKKTSADLHREACALLPRVKPKPHKNDQNPDRQLRIGYVSPNAPLFISPVLESHDKDKFFTTLYLENVTGEVGEKKFLERADSYTWIHATTDEQVAALVRRDEIDILVDLAGHTAGCRLGVLALKPAPVQATWIGYPNTTGLPEMDYRITDAVCDPPEEEWHGTEKLVRLPGSFVCLRPHDESTAVAPPPFAKNGYVTFGSTNELVKINDDVLRLWVDVLAAVPTSRFLFFRHTLHGDVEKRLKERCKKVGMPMDRLIFGCPEAKVELRYLDVYDHIDVLLDAFPWSAHVTACDALMQGVPVVALRGQTSAGRLGASVLTAVRKRHLIAKTRSEYVLTARDLANNLNSLETFRNEIRERVLHSPLCDSGSFIIGLEKAYREMWRNWCDKKAS